MPKKLTSIIWFAGLMLPLILISGVVTGCGGSIPTPSSASSSSNTVTLQGQLTDAVTGEPIIGAKIDIGTRSSATDSRGRFEMAGFPINSGTGVARDYQATITLTGVSAPVNMTNAATAVRYPDRIFRMPASAAAGTSASTHDFKVGKLSATIQGVVGDSGLLTISGATVELQDNTTGAAGNVIRSTTSDATTGAYSFANVEAGVSYKLVGRTSDGAMQGSVTVAKLLDNQTLKLSLGGGAALILSSTDTYSPRIINVSPDNNADIAPGAVNVVFTFNEPIRQDVYSIPNASVVDNIYHDINISYGGRKAAGNYAHTMSWNATWDVLTASLTATGISSKFTVDLSLLSPITTGTTTTLGKLKDNAGNGLEKSPVLTSGNLLSFTTNGGVLALPPVILSPDAPGLDRNATSVTLDWPPASGATKGYNIYRSALLSAASAVAEPFVIISGPVAASTYTDAAAVSGFNLLPLLDVARHYIYRVTSINSDLIESVPSNELTVKDAVAPAAVGAAGDCVAPDGNSLTVITTPVTATTNGQVKFTFSEPLDVVAAENVGNYTGVNVSAAKLTTPTTVVLDFSAPITCVNTNTVVLGTDILDVSGNALSGTLVQRTLTYLP